MNYIILWVTARFSKEYTSFLRLLFGALAGAVYAVIIFFPSLRFIYTLTFKILLSFFIIVISFFPQSLKQFLKILSIFYIVSFVFGGAAFGLFYFTNLGAIISNGVFYISNFPVKLLLLSSLISFFIIKFAWTAIQNRISKENIYILIDIVFENKIINLKGLIDTANSLHDPISNFPVIVVEYNAIKKILPDEIVEIFEKSKEDDLKLISSIMSNSKWISRFRLIPFSSLGKQNGMLLGFKPDQVFINDLDNKKEIKNIIIGVYNNKLSKDESYSALLHPELMNINF
jgi:stage II sporulation protein GA (sporulation sigma-E factor processing peptidase)